MAGPRRGPIESIILAPLAVWAWFAVLGWTSMLVIVMRTITLFVPFGRYQRIVPNPQMGWALTLGTLSPVRVARAPGYDRTRPSVYVQNHVSMLDGYAGCAAIPQGFCGLENAAHLRIPGYGWMMKMAGAIAVRDSSARQFRELMRAFKQRAAEGIGILAFPEGHRTLDGKLRPFEKGVFRLARAAKFPVVPIGVRGMYDVLPKGTWLIKPGRIEIYVWPQIEIEGLTNTELERVSARVHRMLSAYVERGEKLTYEDACLAEQAGAPEPDVVTERKTEERYSSSATNLA